MARTEQRFERTGASGILRNSCTAVRRHLRGRGRVTPTSPPKNSGLLKAEWAKQWLVRDDQETTDWTQADADKRTLEDWRERRRRAAAASKARYTEAADRFDLEHTEENHHPLSLHEGLTKARSSLLTQARTGAIGLNAFLHQRKVPEILSPLCERGCGRETVAHLVLRCERYADQRHALNLPRVRDGATLREALSQQEQAGKVVRWLFKTGRLQEYRLAKELELEASQTTDREEEERPSPDRDPEQARPGGRRRGSRIPGL